MTISRRVDCFSLRIGVGRQSLIFQVVFKALIFTHCSTFHLCILQTNIKTIIYYFDFHSKEFEDGKDIHNPRTNGLKQLRTFKTHDIQTMMTSDDWTRAIFVREPKERLLSAYLDKVVNTKYFKRRYCKTKQKKKHKKINRTLNPRRQRLCHTDGLGTHDYLKHIHENQESEALVADLFSDFLREAIQCKDPHWQPQSLFIDDKWWPYINFVGYVQTMRDDAKRLLQSLYLTKEEENQRNQTNNAWEEHGMTGWGTNGTQSFLEPKTKIHPTNARDKLVRFYTECDEEFVERNWSSEWASPYFHFSNRSRLMKNRSSNNTGRYDNCSDNS